MPFKESRNLRYYTFDIFPDSVLHGVFTRQGGVSPHPWSSLNLGGTVGDSRENVIENRARIFSVINRPVDSIFDVWQVHGTEVIAATQPRLLTEDHQKADAILTDQPGITLMMRFADCVPIFLYDPIMKVVGLVHAGWQGTVDKIAAIAVRKMEQKYHSQAKDILAGIGPSIGPDHYEIGADVVERMEVSLNDDANQFLIRQNGQIRLDLWGANQFILASAGVRITQISGICTACNLVDWYSHRKENGLTGRFGAVIALSCDG